MIHSHLIMHHLMIVAVMENYSFVPLSSIIYTILLLSMVCVRVYVVN